MKIKIKIFFIGKYDLFVVSSGNNVLTGIFD